jgi:hypothetical protein
MLTKTARSRIRQRWLPIAAGLILGAVLASGSLAPAWAKEILLRIGEVRVPADTVVHGDAIAVGGSAYVDGTVEGDVVALGGTVEVRGHVTGSVRANGGNVVLHSSAVVDGNASAVGGTVTREPGASVGGGQTTPPSTAPSFPFPPAPAPGVIPPALPWWLPGMIAGVLFMLHSLFWAGHLLVLATFVGTAWLVAVLFPRAVARVAAVLERDPVMALVAGVVAWPVVMVLTVLLAISVVGLPLALSMPAAVIVAAQLGLTAVALLIGQRAHASEAVRESVVGAVLLAIAFSLPGLGYLVGLAAVTWGLGGVVLTLTETWRFRTRPPDHHVPASPQTHGPTAAGE